jgi:sirohydrochlorin ferrochelatase
VGRDGQDRVRHPRLSPAQVTRDTPPLVAVAHGSKDPRAAATVNEIVSRVRSLGRGRLDVRAAFLDHCAPSLPQVLGSVDACVVVPLLLTAAYHSKTDIPAQLAVSPATPDIRLADTLGPHSLLLAALERRLRETGDFPRTDTSVVLAAAGSSDPAANASVAALAAQWQAQGGWKHVTPAYASAAGPRPDEAVRALRARGGPVLVATYLLAPGYFADKIRDTALAAGARAVSAVLGDAPEVADVIMDRYEAAARAELPVPFAASAQLYPERDRGDFPVSKVPYSGKSHTGPCPDARHACLIANTLSR